jgi:hypothetical protein
MKSIRALLPAFVAGCATVVSLSVAAQATPAAGLRQKVDVRAMVPGMQASDAASEPRPAASTLTRDQRKEATLQARQEGALLPAGEAAVPSVDAPAPHAGFKPALPAPSTAEPVLAITTERSAEATPPTMLATAAPPVAKKSTRKKARSPAASAPV